jgi:citrate/tricarballylate utilization protein
VTAAILVTAALLVFIALTEGINALFSHGGPYRLIPYPGLLVTVLLPTAWSVAVMLRAFAWYWRDTHGPLRDLANWPALTKAGLYAARLRYLRGGGADCYYPDENPSPARRRLHAAVFYGFTACLPRPCRPALCRTSWATPRPIRCCRHPSSWARPEGSA